MTAWNIVKFESKFVDGKIVHLPNVILETGFSSREAANRNLRNYDRCIRGNPNAGLSAAPARSAS